MRDGIYSAIKEFTGYEPASCPWRAFSRPLVRRVLDVTGACGSESPMTFAEYVARPSHRLVEGIAHYHRARGLAQSKRWATERKNRERARG